MIVSDAHDQFRLILHTVVGAAYTAAGYHLEERPTQWAGGLFRYAKALEEGTYAGMLSVLEYQHLYYPEQEVGRFRIALVRSALPGKPLPDGQQPARRLLTGLIWGDFGVRVLPDPEYWWSYETVHEMGTGMAESGQLAVGYGMPWLSGDLVSPRR